MNAGLSIYLIYVFVYKMSQFVILFFNKTTQEEVKKTEEKRKSSLVTLQIYYCYLHI